MWVQGLLKDRTFSQPRKSMRGKGRVTVQFGCCYNYAVDSQGRAPGLCASLLVPASFRSLAGRSRRFCQHCGGVLLVDACSMQQAVHEHSAAPLIHISRV